MATLKFSLTASPTFKKPVYVPIPGAESAAIEFVFKHRTRDQYKELVDNLKGKTNVELIMLVASGWDLDEPFTEESLTKLEQQYMGSTQAIWNDYCSEVTGNRLKN